MSIASQFSLGIRITSVDQSIHNGQFVALDDYQSHALNFRLIYRILASKLSGLLSEQLIRQVPKTSSSLVSNHNSISSIVPILRASLNSFETRLTVPSASIDLQIFTLEQSINQNRALLQMNHCSFVTSLINFMIY